MKIAVRYQSRGGNTKAVAEEIANEAGIKAEPLTVALDGTIDLLFVGGGVYAWKIDNELRKFIENLSPDTVKCIVPFTTAGGMDKTKSIAEIAASKGINIHPESLSILFGLRNHKLFSGKQGKAVLDSKQAEAIKEFVKKTIQ